MFDVMAQSQIAIAKVKISIYDKLHSAFPNWIVQVSQTGSARFFPQLSCCFWGKEKLTFCSGMLYHQFSFVVNLYEM